MLDFYMCEYNFSDNVHHRGVSCDGCSVGIRGFRYKCIQCRDYDLCGDCEGRGIHSSHFMIRMPVPTIWVSCIKDLPFDSKHASNLN